MNNYYNDKNFSERVKFKKKKKNNYVPLIWGVIIVFISILIGVGILFAANLAKVPILSGLSEAIKQNFNKVISEDLSKNLSFIGGKQNILLLGVDSNGKNADRFKGTRSDTLILLNLDPMTKTVNAVSIPRDSKVYIANGHGLGKINSAHALGGPELTVKTIERTFGIKINHYLEIDFSGIKEIVKALDGVYINVEKSMHYTDRTAGLYIDLNSGYQKLTPEQAEGYLRFRHDAVGDIGRMRRQQWFIRGIVQRMQTPDIVMKLPQIAQTINKYVKTDMNFYELSQFASFARNINLEEVQAATLPGAPSKYGHISYWILDSEKSQDIIDKLIYREQPPVKTEPITASIMRSKDFSSEQVAAAKDLLQQAGYKVVCQGRSRDPHAQILAHSKYVGINDARVIKNKIPALKKAQFILSPDNYQCASTDLTVVLGK